MPSKKQYNLVHNDDYDTRIPLHSEEAFHRGIIFHAKFIGSLEVPRPTSRVEIVAAMRKIRYEFKAKGIKKKKVTIQVSVDGLKVTLRKKKKKQEWMDENKMFLMHHPIYRIFYVSHDSHDLKIFSYIARDGNSNAFKCNVFKSSKKSQAMRVVRTVGQAFEVCHKLSLNSAPEDRERESGQRDLLHPDDDYEDQDETASDRPPPTPPSIHKDISLLVPSIDTEDTLPEIRSQEVPTTTVSTTPMRESPLHGTNTSDCGMLVGGELTALKHEIQLLRERLEQQCQQTRAAGAHARLLEGQLAAETAARVEAQTRTHQLLMQNKELLEHIGALVGHLREQERTSNHANPTLPGTTGVGGGAIPATPTVPDLSTLGQPQRARAPGSPWELDAPSIALYPYSTEPIYSPNTVVSNQGFNASSEQLSFQNQLLERLHSISAYQAQRSPYATPSPYPMGTNLLLRPSNSRPSVNSSQPSPNSTSLRVSQANSFSSSPVMVHKLENYASSNMDSNGDEQQQFQQQLQQQLQQQQLQQQQLQLQHQQQQQFQQQLQHQQQQNLQQQQQSLHHQHQQQQQYQQQASEQPQQQQSAFIKPLPQAQTTSSILTGDIDPRPRFTISDEPPPIILDPPPPGRKSVLNNRNRNSENLRSLNSVTTESGATTPEDSENGAAKPQESQKNFVHFSRTPGPPPSRTTSAKLPSRSETMSQVQRTTWARHTTK